MRFKYRLIIFLSVSLLFKTSLTSGQQTNIYTEPVADYHTAVDLFDKQKYAAAREKFENIVSSNLYTEEMRGNAAYYLAVSAYELFHRDTEERLQYFLLQFPQNPAVNSAYFFLGKLYYRDKQYRKAVEWFEQVDIFHLS